MASEWMLDLGVACFVAGFFAGGFVLGLTLRRPRKIHPTTKETTDGE